MAVPNGLYISNIPEIAEDEASYLEDLDAEEWSTALSRRTQHYGAVYDYSTRSLSTYEARPMDHCSTVKRFAELLEPEFQDFGSRKPNQCIVNEYVTRQRIAPHTDAKVFGPIIMTISLGSSMQIRFTHSTEETFTTELVSGDVLLLSGAARYEWKHELLPSSKKDFRRVSLTFRTY
jgi:alkylated DNA repair dioxygenase AlkB